MPGLLAAVDAVDLFHYDSEKSLAGRQFAWDLVLAKMSTDGIFVMDDMQDNLFFRDLVERLGRPYQVFAFGRKYLGAMQGLGKVGS